MMDGAFSHDLRGSMALIPGGGGPVPEAPFIRTPGLLAGAAEGAFRQRGLRDLAVALPAPVALAGKERAGEASGGAEQGADQGAAGMSQPGGAAPAPLPDVLPDTVSGLMSGPVSETMSGPAGAEGGGAGLAAGAGPRFEALPLAAARSGAAEAAAQAATQAAAQARAEVLAELDAERAALAESARALAAALARISQPPASDLALLTAHLGQAVAHLAATRAGQAIDADAAPFLRRIHDLAGRITAGFDRLTLRLHPADCAAVSACLAAACPPDLAGMAQARLRPDPGLLRGDVALWADGLRLEDLILPPAAMTEGADHD
jgi:hypothetical protein